MRGSGDLGRLKTEEWDFLQELVDRFEAACRTDDAVDLTQHLPPTGDALRIVALHELIKSDLEIRWRRGQKVELESYLERFAELGPKAGLAPALIYEEYRVRHHHGDRPPLTAYRDRFPEQFAELGRLLEQQPLDTVTNRGDPAAPAAPAPAPPPTDPGAQKTVSPAQNVLPIGGGYKLIKLIGHGAFAEVWRAEAPGGFPVAVKRVFRPIDHEEAQRELEALNRIKDLSHPFLLQTHAYHLLEGRLYVIMDLADGNLKDRLKQCQEAGRAALPVVELVRYFEEAAEALDYMHSMHVIHRDIKPQNILLHKGHVKVADFGLARMLEGQRLMATASGSGTPVYMAPEIWQNRVSQHSDQYSLALTCAELRLGRRPFVSTDMHGLMIEHIQGQPNLEGASDEEQQVLLKGLSKDPEKRYESCQAFVRAFKRSVAGQLDVSLSAPGGSLSSHPTDRRSHDSNATEQLPGGTMFRTVPPAGRGRKSHSATRPEHGSKPATGAAPWRKPEPPGRRWLVWAVLGAMLLGVAVAGVWALVTRGGGQPTGKQLDVVTRDGWDRASDEILAVGSKGYPAAIDVHLGDDRVRFLLVHHGQGDDPSAFYIMENKVSVGQFRRFLKEAGTLNPRPNMTWQEMARLGINQDDEHPIMGVIVPDAARFAASLGGKLPMPEQWDRAARRPSGPAPGLGPFNGKWPDNNLILAIGRKGTLKCGEAKDDVVSPPGCRDMAGNGQEWTRGVLLGGNTEYTPLEFVESLPLDHTIVLRGASYDAPEPLLYDKLQKPPLVPGTSPRPNTGFRVVIELGK